MSHYRAKTRFWNRLLCAVGLHDPYERVDLAVMAGKRIGTIQHRECRRCGHWMGRSGEGLRLDA